jgi:hypothetical protein
MKLAAFVALALVATGVSAQDIEVTSVLRMDGKVVEQFKGAKPSGQTQTYSNLKRIPYKESATQIEGGKVKTKMGHYETGFHMEILPTLGSDGTIQYVLSVSNDDMKAIPHKVGDMEVESPTGSNDKFVLSMVANQGEKQEFSFDTGKVGPSSPTDEPAKHYVLTVTATALKN